MSYKGIEKPYQPLLWEKQGFPKEAPTKTIKLDPPRNRGTTTTTLKLEHTFYIISGKETEEQIMEWWRDFLTMIKHNQEVSWSDKKNILLHIVSGEAETTVKEAFTGTSLVSKLRITNPR